MSRIRNNRKGFSLAEVLIVAAIIVVLAGISTVAVFRYQRSLKQLELDGIAKEIFVAAQNHLTMAESQGYLGMKEPDDSTAVNPFGNEDDADKGIYFFVVGANSDTPASGSYASPDTGEAKKTVLSLMLPFASVDETVRLGGSYVIRYQKDPGLVLDVFYVEKNGRYPYETLGYTSRTAGNDYSLLMSDSTDGYHGANNKGNRRNASNFNNAVLGWYGGDEAAALPTGTELTQPKVKIHNEETLWVEIEYSNYGEKYKDTDLELVVYGLENGLRKGDPKKISLISSNGTTQTVQSDEGFKIQEFTPDHPAEGKKYLKVVLDDITSSNSHFAQLFSGLIAPGSDIEVYAVAKNNYSLTTSDKERSDSDYSNSLFAYDADDDDLTASVGYIRHLENLEESISGYNPGAAVTALQIDSLVWTNFFGGTAQITNSSGTSITSGNQAFVPVSPAYSLDYNGQTNSISAVKINTPGFEDAGLFGVLGSDDKVSNLELLNFSVTSASGNAGALAGISTGKVTNVLAHNSGSGAAPTVTGSGSVGGLIGSITGGTVTKSAAALVVNSSGSSAGGLIGSATGGTVSASYSGGHTDGTGKYSSTSYNVTAASGNAGGLIGDAGSAEIVNCYSTCSAAGATAGGLVGSAGGSISDCYATGLVSGTTTAEGAFAGTLSSVPSNCKYYMIINERSKGTGKGYEYLAPVGSTTVSTAGITALDDDPSSFNRFAQVRAEGTAGSNPAAAVAYDSTLSTQFGGKYDLQSVNRLGASVVPSDFVASHYGDWPSPEIWVINTPTGGSTSSSDYSFNLTGAYWGGSGSDPYTRSCTLEMTNNTGHKVDSITAALRFDGSGSIDVTTDNDPAHVQFTISGNIITVTFNGYGNGFNAGQTKSVNFRVQSDSAFTVEVDS